MTGDELERERAALLVGLEAGDALTEDQRRRVVGVAMADWERAQNDQTLTGRDLREVRDQIVEMLSGSGMELTHQA